MGHLQGNLKTNKTNLTEIPSLDLLKVVGKKNIQEKYSPTVGLIGIYPLPK